MTRLLRAVLATRGLTAVAAYDAVQGFQAAERQHPRFILVDWHMPAGGGPQLLRKLKDHPATRGIPVVVVTGDGSPAIPEEAAALGARGVLHKPIDTDQFVEVVKSLVE
jgi:two-component system chemotaxis response regulator CheY